MYKTSPEQDSRLGCIVRNFNLTCSLQFKALSTFPDKSTKIFTNFKKVAKNLISNPGSGSIINDFKKESSININGNLFKIFSS
jgi:hypothetical protein